MSNFGEIQRGEIRRKAAFAFGDPAGENSTAKFDYCIKYIKGPGSITINKTSDGYTVNLKATLSMKCFCESFPDTPDIGGLGAWPQGCKGSQFHFYISRSYPGGSGVRGGHSDDLGRKWPSFGCGGNKTLKINKTMSMGEFIAGYEEWNFGGKNYPSLGKMCMVVTPGNQSIVLAIWVCGGEYSFRPGELPGEPPIKIICYNISDIAECMGEAFLGKLLCADSNEDTVADFITAYIDSLKNTALLGNCYTSPK